jgi:hypothetical protein
LLEKGHRVRTTVRDPGTNCTWSDFYLVTRLKQSILDFLYFFFYQVCYAMPSTIYIYKIVINTKLFFFLQAMLERLVYFGSLMEPRRD